MRRSQRGIRWGLLGCAWMLVLLRLGTTMADGTPTVRLIYLVPSDRVIQPSYAAAIEHAITQLQIWYRNEMGNGKSFLLHTPIVEIYETPHRASWYATNPAGDFVVWFWNNALADGFAATGGRFFDPENRWIFYLDADPACGQLTGGTSGVALLPANDLRGLVGQPNQSPCPGEPPDTAGICRWVGGLGHELGHAFDLPHPAGCEDSDPGTFCPSDALLWLGFRDYPETYLLPEDIARLNASPFFVLTELPVALPPCSGIPVRVEPFAAFTVKVEMKGDAFEVKGPFTLGAASDGIAPLTEEVSFQMGPFTTTLPAGSFTQDKNEEYKFEGVINGVALEVKITPLGGATFDFTAEGKGANLSGTVNPVTVMLRMGIR